MNHKEKELTGVILLKRKKSLLRSSLKVGDARLLCRELGIPIERTKEGYAVMYPGDHVYVSMPLILFFKSWDAFGIMWSYCLEHKLIDSGLFGCALVKTIDPGKLAQLLCAFLKKRQFKRRFGVWGER